jgi:rfaE bifunctional protein kinase chain/domain
MKRMQTLELQSLLGSEIGVIGDVMLDCYVEGKVSRISPEAPIPVVVENSRKMVVGGAANVCRNLIDFGVCFDLMGVVGEDRYADTLREILLNGRSADHLIVDSSRPTSVKTRVLGNGQQIVRVDNESKEELSASVEEAVIASIENLNQSVTSLIVSDYSKGVLTSKVVGAIRELGETGVKIIVDPHPNNKQIWSGIHTLKPNLHELQLITGVSFDLKMDESPFDNYKFNQALEILMQKWSIKNLVVTLSELGMVYIDENNHRHWEPTMAEEVFDVSGAGDTAIAFYTMGVSAGWTGKDCIRLANCASGLVVKKLGTASLTFEEMNRVWNTLEN